MHPIKPVGTKILILPDSPSEVSEGGIIITNPKPVEFGEVVAVSEDIDCPLKVGDRVNFEPGGLQVEGYLLMPWERVRYIIG